MPIILNDNRYDETYNDDGSITSTNIGLISNHLNKAVLFLDV